MRESKDLTEKELKTENRPLQKGIAAVVSVLFLAAILLGLIVGIGRDPKGLMNSLRTYRARNFLNGSEDDPFDMLAARIASLDDHLSGSLPLNSELSELNASFQFGIGKNTVITGNTQMLRLDNGQLYVLTQQKSLAHQADRVIELYDWVDGRIPFFFSYINPAFFNGGLQLPEGYDIIDTGDELADEMLRLIRAHGIEALDSRTFFAGSGYTNEELELKTDRHWTSLAALLATSIYAEEINELTGRDLDVSRLSLDRFEAHTVPYPYQGSYGRKIGRNAPLETMKIYLPAYDTQLSRHTRENTGEYTDLTGPFETSVFRGQFFDSEKNGINIEGQNCLGIIEGSEEIVNYGDCEDMTILVIRDSFTSPICSYLSLTARRVVSIDTRWDMRTAKQMIEQCDPDIIVVSISRLMLENVGLRMM